MRITIINVVRMVVMMMMRIMAILTMMMGTNIMMMTRTLITFNRS